ncbi:MAG: trigger factor [Planctomycetota bacterium]|jgi:trigger factor|nr:trigger factor [Planctomycetota bacterium]
MEYTFADIGACRKSITLKYTPVEVNEAMDAALTNVDSQVQFKGFRRGKAPRHLLLKKYGDVAEEKARLNLVNKALMEILEKDDIDIFGEFAMPPVNHPIVVGQPYMLNLEVDCYPVFDLPDCKQLTYTPFQDTVDDSQVEAGIDKFRQSLTHYYAGETVAENDVLNVSIKGVVADKEFLSLDDKNLRVAGEEFMGMNCPELVAKFTGAKVNDTIQVAITLPEEHPNPELRGKLADFTVLINSIQRPEYKEFNDEFVQQFGFSNLDNLKQRLRISMVQSAFNEFTQNQKEELIDQLISLTSFPIPQHSLGREIVRLKNILEDKVKKNNSSITPDELGKILQENQKYIGEMAERNLRWKSISHHLAKREKIEVVPEDLDNAVKMYSQELNVTPAEFVKNLKNQSDGLDALRDQIVESKVVKYLVDNAKSKGAGSGADSDIEKANVDAVNIAALGEKQGTEPVETTPTPEAAPSEGEAPITGDVSV